MKVDHRDEDLFDHTTEVQRDAFAKRLDELSDLAIAKLATTPANAREVIGKVKALASTMADILVWTEAACACTTLLDDSAEDETTMAAVIEHMQKNYDDLVKGAPLLYRAEPEFYPHQIEAYGKIVRHLKQVEAAVDFVEDLCSEIGVGAFERYKDCDEATVNAVSRLSAVKAVEEVRAAGGFASIERIKAMRNKAISLGLNPDELGIPKVFPQDFQPVPETGFVPEALQGLDLATQPDDMIFHVRGPAALTKAEFQSLAIMEIAAATGLVLSTAHLTETSPGNFVLLVDEHTGKSITAEDHAKREAVKRTAELDGGAGSGVPHDESDMPLMQERTTSPFPPDMLRPSESSAQVEELLARLRAATPQRYPAKLRQFGRRAADAAE